MKRPRAESLPDLRDAWPRRIAGVRAFQARTDLTGITRKPRDPEKAAFLASRGQLSAYESTDPSKARLQRL